MSDVRRVWSPGGRKWVEVQTLNPDPTTSKAARMKRDGSRLIGCPRWWFKAALAATKGKGELAVAIYLWRLRAITKSKAVEVPNEWLRNIGVTRNVKYRALARLEQAGLVTVERRGKASPRVRFLR